MSAVWMRAHEFGQPFTLTVIGVSSSGTRSSSSPMRSAARALVSTMASLQYSMPVQAIVLRRHCDGRACRPSSASASTSDSTRSSSTSSTTSFCMGVVATRSEPCASTTSATWFSSVPEMRPTVAATPT